MVTWMIHPQHGQHPATGGEIEHLKANGWTMRPPKDATPAENKEHLDLIKAPIESTFEEAPRVKRAYNRKQKA